MANKELIIDTGFFIAILSKADQYHEKAIKLKKTLDKRKWITTWPVLTEVCHLLTSRKTSHVIASLLQLYDLGGYEIFHLSKNHIPQLLKILEKYKNLPVDFADASLLVLAEELGHGDIVSTDERDFQTYRWKSHKPFHNLFK